MSRVLIYISKNEIRNLALYSLYNTMQKEMDEDHNYLIWSFFLLNWYSYVIYCWLLKSILCGLFTGERKTLVFFF